MNEGDEDFFTGKRAWSLIKDQVLRDYIPPYLAKVKHLGRPIFLIDAYAGPGVFDDGTEGSPFIMCQAAERYAKGQYTAFFVNKEEKYQKKLEEVIRVNEWTSSAHSLLADSHKLLQLVPPVLKDHTVFLYLDPFGLKGCEFSLLEPFLLRSHNLSTELLLTMNMPVVHRLAACNTKDDSSEAGRIKSYRERLTKVFGGDYWRDILCQSTIPASEREKQLIEAYLDKLRQYLPFTGSCPVREKIEKRIKYFIVFASRHKDAMLLLNDIMVDAYFGKMHEAEYAETLFKDISWREMPPLESQPVEKLENVVLDTVARHAGATRGVIWLEIIQNYFMLYHQTEYRKIVARFVNEGKLVCPTSHRKNQLNDNCRLYLP